MKIVTLLTNFNYTEDRKNRLEALGESVVHSVKKLEGDEIVELAKDADILTIGMSGVKKLDRYVMENCPKLKLISVHGTGTDFVDVAAAKELGIKVCNLKGANAQSVAEHAWGTILSLSKRITQAHNGVQKGKISFLDYPGIEVKGKTIGILGFGEIGSRVAKIAQGFDMRVFAYTRSEKEAKDVEFLELDEVLQKSDVIVTSLSLNDSTKNIINKENISKMKDQVILVNPAREGLVDKEAVLEALQDDKFFGFGMELDTNNPPDERFYKYQNVILTPHNANLTPTADEKSNNLLIENIEAFVAGRPQNLVV